MTDFQFIWLCIYGFLLFCYVMLIKIMACRIDDKLDELINILKEEKDGE